MKYEENTLWSMPYLFHMDRTDIKALGMFVEVERDQYIGWPKLTPEAMKWLTDTFGPTNSLTNRCASADRWLMFFHSGGNVELHFRSKSDASIFKLRWWR